VESLINPLSNPALWSGVPANVLDYEEYFINYHPSTSLRFPGKAILTIPPVTLTEGAILCFNGNSFRVRSEDPLRTQHIIRINGREYKVKHPHAVMGRIALPLFDTTFSGMEIECAHSDFYAISDLRLVWGHGLPMDLLQGVKRGIERYMHPKIPMGNVTVKAGDREIEFLDWDFLERNMVVKLGGNRYQIKQIRDNIASLMSTYDGDSVVADYTGVAEIYMPVEIGYYDREEALPGVSIWFSGPTPIERYVPHDYGAALIDGNWFIGKNASQQTWRVSLEVSAHSPELVAIASQAVRKFLSLYTVWYHGDKLWFHWKETAQITEPVEDYDIVPRSVYDFEIEILEELWELKQEIPGKPNITVML
jgi:hypothetical protein